MLLLKSSLKGLHWLLHNAKYTIDGRFGANLLPVWRRGYHLMKYIVLVKTFTR